MKKQSGLLFAILFFGSALFSQTFSRLAHTFSIVARDPVTGEMAVGVQSHWFSVGTAVSWAEAGAGAVATQSFVNKAYGMKGLELMKSGKTAEEALKALLAQDEGREVRQVAMIDKDGHVSVHTGKDCIDYASHISGENFSVQSNMMLNNRVCPAMAKSFTSNSKLPLAERVLKALEAGQAAGGDVRGKQSAAILVVAAKASDKPWDDRLVDLRVEDNPAPLVEMDRLLRLQRAYQHMNNGDLYTEKNDMTNAMKEYRAAMNAFPDNLEMKYWTAITLANNGKVSDADPMLQAIYKKDPHWRELTLRLPKVKLLNVSSEDLKKLTR